jgi:flotillin
MRMKASAYKQYGDAAVLALTLEALPKVAAQVAAPLAKTDQIVLLGGTGNTVDAITQMVSQIPPAVQALTGVNLTGVLGRIPGAVMQTQPQIRQQ